MTCRSNLGSWELLHCWWKSSDMTEKGNMFIDEIMPYSVTFFDHCLPLLSLSLSVGWYNGGEQKMCKLQLENILLHTSHFPRSKMAKWRDCACVCVWNQNSYLDERHMKLSAEAIGLVWVFLNDGQVGSLIPSESWLACPSGPAPVYCGGPDWMIWFLKSDGLDCPRQRTSEMGREERNGSVRHTEKMTARWNLRCEKDEWIVLQGGNIHLRETNKANLRQ